MPFFPAYLNLQSKPVLVVGAGKIAARKIEKLLLFNPKIDLVAKQANEKVLELIKNNSNICFQQRAFNFSDLSGKHMAIVAIDDIPLQKQIYDHCQQTQLLCNCVDSPDYCNFIFPALIIRGDLTVGVNTAGKAPYVSARIRKLIDEYLPTELNTIVDSAHKFRETVSDKKQATQLIKDHIDKLFSKLTN